MPRENIPQTLILQCPCRYNLIVNQVKVMMNAAVTDYHTIRANMQGILDEVNMQTYLIHVVNKTVIFRL